MDFLYGQFFPSGALKCGEVAVTFEKLVKKYDKMGKFEDF